MISYFLANYGLVMREDSEPMILLLNNKNKHKTVIGK